MPGPPAQSSRLGQYGAYLDQVVHANSTLNAFVGGKQKAWMANAAPVQPSPRPQPHPPRPQTQQNQQNLPPALPTTPANVNVLPSPAPSDEPSPALSNPLDSPNPRIRSVPTTTQKQTAGQSQTVQNPLSPSISWASRPAQAGPAAAAGPIERTAALERSAGPPSDSTRTSPVMAPPYPTQPNQTGQLANGGNDFGSPVVASARPVSQSSLSAPGEGPAGKRRRVERANQQSHADAMVLTSPHSVAAPSPRAGAAGLKVDGMVTLIDYHIDQQGGDQALQSLVEKPRFQILRDACAKKDYFYLILHQLYCLWSVSPQTVSDLLLGDMGAISKGFEILDSVLKKNSGLSRPNLEWCANFPCQKFDLPRIPIAHQVATFLACLANNWTALHEASFNRVCPYLMDEMIGKLRCCSVSLQYILFTASRRRLGVVDGQLGTEMDHLFRKDQQEHMSGGQFRILLSSDAPGELERRNQVLIKQYQQIIASARHQEQERAHRQQHLLMQQQSLQNQQAQAQLLQQVRLQPNRLYDWQQHQVAPANPASSASLQNAHPLNPSSQRPVTSPMMGGTHQTMNTPPVPQDIFSPPATGRQIGRVPPTLVLQGSSAAAMPTSQMVQSMPSPQSHTQSGLSHQQHGFGNHQSPTQSMQSPQYMTNIQNMAATQQAAAQQQWPRQAYIPTGQQMSALQSTGSPQFVHGPASNLRSQRPQQAVANLAPSAPWYHVPTTFVPRPGQVVERSDWPHSHLDRRSLMMSLHQARARSPDRTRRADQERERHYQAVHSFAIEPFRLIYFHELELTVSPETHSLLCKKKEFPLLNGQRSVSTAREYTNGSLRYRLRCCRIDSEKAVTESDWVTKDTSWPDYIFPHFNAEKLVVRRGTHHGKDLPVELTDFVVPGLNKLKVATMQAGPTADKIVRRFHLAVEVLETLSHSAVLEHVWANGLVDFAQTLERIRKRIDAVPDEDGIAVIDRSGVTTSELSIDLTDPFSASIFSIPARGSACTHMECFDLETWLNTRPMRQATGHQHALTFPKRLEPSEPDKWKCPICFADARPRSLRIDRFLLSVRRQLEEQDKLDTKSILVAADGTWRPVIEPIDDDDAGSDGDGPVSKGPVANLRKRPSKSSSVERAAIEVIELD